MTVANASSSASYTGNGVTTAFSTGFRFLDASHLVVRVAGVLQVLGVHYTVSGASQSSGTVTFGSAPANGAAITIERTVPLTQLTSFRTQGAFAPASHENAHDRHAMAAQQLRRQLDAEEAARVAADGVLSAAITAGTTLPGSISFVATGTTFARTLAARHADIINLRDFQPAADGVTDDTAKLNQALTAAAGKQLYIPAGDYYFPGEVVAPGDCIIYGDGRATRLHPNNAGGVTLTVSSSNVTIRDLRFEGSTPATISIKNGAKNVRVENCQFKGVGQAVYLWACEEVAVVGCTFESCTYGIIQRGGFVSSHVRVLDCTFKDMVSDAVEANCTAAAPSEDWVVAGCQYLGAQGFPTAATEKRFVGITSVKNVIIANNVVKQTAGDSAIHLEDTLGNVAVLGNVFENCTCSSAAGFSAYLWIIHSEKDVLVVGNTFVHSDTGLPATKVLDTSPNAFTNKIVFAGNRLKGNASKTLSGIYLGFHNHMLIEGNSFEDLDYAVKVNAAKDISFVGNRVTACNYGIKSDDTTSSGNNRDWVVSGNSFDCATKAIEVRRNTLGSGASERWNITGNVANADIEMYDAIDCRASDNAIKAPGTVCRVDRAQHATPTRCYQRDNTIAGLPTSASGRHMTNGDGVAGTFTIPHGLAGTPKAAIATVGTVVGSPATRMTVDWDATNLYVTFDTPPVVGTNNVRINWHATAE